MSSIETLFSGRYIERAAELRTDPDALAAALSDQQTRFLVVWQHRCLARGDGPVLLSREDLRGFSLTHEALTFLGRLNDCHLFAVSLEADDEPQLVADGSFGSLRTLSNSLDAESLGLMAYAHAMTTWQHHHRHCGLCGYPNHRRDAGFVLACSNPDCGHRVFPRLDPAIIVLVHHGKSCLLGRQPSWPENRYSTIAGFVEPGESLEDAVRREVLEETNIRVGACRYLASQPWPFPSSLMIGYHAEALSRRIVLNDKELADARWVTREDIVAGAVILPPPMSVAYRLIEAWFDSHGGASLASHGLEVPPLTVKRKRP